MSLNAQAKDASKMPVFDGDEKNWTSWKRLFRSYLRRNSRKEFDLLDAVTKIRNGDEAKTLKLKNKNEDASTDDEEELLVQLYDSLVLACRGQAAAVITTLPVEDDEDGAKAWLALLYKYEVHTRARFVSIHHQMLNARLDMANPDEYFQYRQKGGESQRKSHSHSLIPRLLGPTRARRKVMMILLHRSGEIVIPN